MAKTSIRKKKVTSKAKSAIKTQALVLAEEISTEVDGCRLGIMTLNSAKTMNAVDLEMVNLIDDILARWQEDESIVAVIMKGAGEKAFCAGGDIRQLYSSMKAEGNDHLQYADDFFKGEYSKNYRVHKFGKPLIAWGHGFVMGGGLGLFIGANHKVGTETLKLAWPEIRIGLFPDVAGSYYLSRLPFPVGHWMALTGSQMNARDCRSVGLINYCLKNDDLADLIKQLQKQPWQANRAMNNQYVRDLLKQFEIRNDQAEFPTSLLTENKDAIEDLFADFKGQHALSLHDNKLLLGQLAEKFSQIEHDDNWFVQGRNNFFAGCPGTAHLIMQQLQLGKNMTLKEVVMWELALALQSVRHPDFAEGIRAMVVDKDFKPQWQHDTFAEVPESWVEGLMKPLWQEGAHPFHQL